MAYTYNPYLSGGVDAATGQPLPVRERRPRLSRALGLHSVQQASRRFPPRGYQTGTSRVCKRQYKQVSGQRGSAWGEAARTVARSSGPAQRARARASRPVLLNSVSASVGMGPVSADAGQYRTCLCTLPQALRSPALTTSGRAGAGGGRPARAARAGAVREAGAAQRRRRRRRGARLRHREAVPCDHAPPREARQGRGREQAAQGPAGAAPALRRACADAGAARRRHAGRSRSPGTGLLCCATRWHRLGPDVYPNSNPSRCMARPTWARARSRSCTSRGTRTQ